MILLTERIEEQLKQFLQKDIQVVVKDRKLYNGKLLLYRIDGFYIQLIFAPSITALNNSPVSVEIPYPFNIIEGAKKLSFDYRLEALAEKDFNLLFTLQSISKKRESKFYNSTLEIAQT